MNNEQWRIDNDFQFKQLIQFIQFVTDELRKTVN